MSQPNLSLGFFVIQKFVWHDRQAMFDNGEAMFDDREAIFKSLCGGGGGGGFRFIAWSQPQSGLAVTILAALH